MLHKPTHKKCLSSALDDAADDDDDEKVNFPGK